MLIFRRRIVLNLFKYFDLLIVSASFLLGALVVSQELSYASLKSFLSMRIKIQNFAILFLILLIWYKIYDYFGLYSSKRLSQKLDEVIDVVKAASLGTLTIAFSGVIFHVEMITPLFLLVFWLSVTCMAILSRLLGRFILDKIRTYGRNLRNMLIVGANPRSIKFANNIEDNPQLGYKIIGFMDDKWAGTDELLKNGYQLKAGLNEFSNFIRTNVVDEVAIALPVKSRYDQISQIVDLCKEQGIIIRFLSDIFNQKLARTTTERFAGDNIVTFHTGKLAGWPLLVKRITDLSFSLIAIVFSLPVFLIISLGIKFTSPGTVFFIQERVGLNKRRFRLYKFRTMVPDAEKLIHKLEYLNEVDGPAFKIKNDPRVTAFGRFLRKTSLDELPQFINVLKGDMSLVGPRPLPFRDYNGFNHDWQRRRFSVRPGITCLWQVNGRSTTTFEKWMKQDMDYIDNWSLRLDFMILLKTIPAVFNGEGAA